MTPHHKAKLEALKAKGRRLDVGDVGFWVTCQRTQESKALEEIISICDEVGRRSQRGRAHPMPSNALFSTARSSTASHLCLLRARARTRMR